VVALYIPTFIRLVKFWWVDPDYSHGFLVIPASLFFCGIAWQRFQTEAAHHQLAATDSRGVIWGALEIALGFVLHLLGLAFDFYLVDVISLICILRGTLLLVAGPAWNRAFAFPALFLIFLAPLPPVAHQKLAIFMQQSVALVSTTILDACGVPIHRQGYLMHIPGYTMEVGEACSGLRSMMAILALAVAIGFLVNGSQRYCWILTMLALPIAGAANCLRVVLTGIIMLTLGREYAVGVYHEMEGMVLEAIAAGILVTVAFALLRYDRPTTTAGATP
ncbi:MAG TPA: exosortase/archaeosortase family protein, partial [Pirellulaceae bacterium]|nr:exosortase/archaeosortase family protein [Pirellulaceae bacterium]